ncbi:CsgG/HfaB family protein [Geothrix sp. PMB-07]|uniref:CsgG/HfaB family protein n=1 Tax=Geothrix sp. PMB-07 TaxID=3068640 RepID=UPI002741364A|nr:CsgG/HfaB family protein [Geothrix sp. PMB-07]WLT33329.1 CsgG/HfaB family protein [Geothrix sp. PMB-07]
MRLSKLFVSLMAVVALAAPAFAQKKLSKEEKAKLPRIAILEFKAAPDAWHGWHHGGWGNQMSTISNQLRDLFTTEIVEKGKNKIRVVERERLNEIRDELHFQQSGEVDTATVQKIGKLLGVKYVMTGKVTRFAYKEGGFSSGWGVGALVSKVTGDGMAGAVAGSVNIKKASFTGRLDIRLIEVETGEVLGAWKDEDKVDNTSVKVAGTGGDVQYDEELVNKVFEPIVARITPKLLRATVSANEDE